jgi:hypothetical protein
MKAIYEDNGSEQLTVGELLAKLSGIPRDAKIVSLQASNAQRDGWVWSFRAEAEVRERPTPGITYPPAMRGPRPPSEHPYDDPSATIADASWDRRSE